MLKKLVKYGNSNALILDKAIMELLNMHEGSVVKFRTDGTSLIITPVEEKAPVVTSNIGETLMNISSEQREAAQVDPVKKRALEEWAPGTENFVRLTEAFAPIMAQNQKAVTIFASEAYRAEADALAAKHHGGSSKAFMKDLRALQDKYAPGYHEKALQEMRAAAQKIGYPIDLFAEESN